MVTGVARVWAWGGAHAACYPAWHLLAAGCWLLAVISFTRLGCLYVKVVVLLHAARDCDWRFVALGRHGVALHRDCVAACSSSAYRTPYPACIANACLAVLHARQAACMHTGWQPSSAGVAACMFGVG